MERGAVQSDVRTGDTGEEMQSGRRGFTLIEMSIVLVVIGLVVGGVLVGQDLIRAAYVRAQISQIEKFNTAVNTFYGKYQALPGDMNNSTATTFGFSAATHNAANPPPAGQGDGNGIIDGGTGVYSCSNTLVAGSISCTIPTANGEMGVFWVDLSSSAAGQLIEGGFNTATETGGVVNVATTVFSKYVPEAKLAAGNYIYVMEINGVNYFNIANINSFNYLGSMGLVDFSGVTVAQAYNIDKKIDDGFPTTGNVAAVFVMLGNLSWAAGGGGVSAYKAAGSPFSGTASTAPDAPGPTTCFDNSNTPATYSMAVNKGAAVNCALILKMQGGD